jgi:hypothetical protein
MYFSVAIPVRKIEDKVSGFSYANFCKLCKIKKLLVSLDYSVRNYLIQFKGGKLLSGKLKEMSLELPLTVYDVRKLLGSQDYSVHNSLIQFEEGKLKEMSQDLTPANFLLLTFANSIFRLARNTNYIRNTFFF